MIPGELFPGEEPIEMNQGRESVSIRVLNTGDRPVQVGSHYHFYEVNDALVFDRKIALGKRLDVLPGTSIRFEPGEERFVRIISILGKREIYGFNAKINGPLEKTP